MTFDLDMTLKERSNVKFVYTLEFLVKIPLIWAQDKDDRIKTKRAMNWNGPGGAGAVAVAGAGVVAGAGGGGG